MNQDAHSMGYFDFVGLKVVERCAICPPSPVTSRPWFNDGISPDKSNVEENGAIVLCYNWHGQVGEQGEDTWGCSGQDNAVVPRSAPASMFESCARRIPASVHPPR